MRKNNFTNNVAIFGGGGIYFQNKILKESPYRSNIFKENKAQFANDFYTFPASVRFQDDLKYKSWVNRSAYSLNIIPGLTQINLNFSIVDYYGQNLRLLNRYYF